MERNEKSLRRFGQLLITLRKQKNLTESELAVRSGIDLRRLTRIEAGEVNFHFTTIIALARGLGVTPEELLRAL